MTVEADTTARAGAVPMTRASTIVTNALPTIVADLHAGQSVYTWVITATLLATTVVEGAR